MLGQQMERRRLLALTGMAEVQIFAPPKKELAAGS